MVRMRLMASLLVCALAVPAFALNNRSAVSVNGSDLNPCTPASPCRSFGAAIAQTNPGGEVIALDSAGYGPFTVPTSMTISGAPGVHAALTVSSGDGITVNATNTDIVAIRNLVLIGSGGGSGINNLQSAELLVLDCAITNFSLDGILTQSGRLTVDHCVIHRTLLNAIELSGTTATVAAIIGHSLIETYANGVIVNSAATAHITACIIAGGNVGVNVLSSTGSGAVAATAFVESSAVSYNNHSFVASASFGNNTAAIYLAQNAISFSSVGAQTSGPSTVNSFGNNRFVAVTTVGTLNLVAQQ